MIDLNHIINMEILKARMDGMNDIASELLEIASTGNNIPEWIESRERMVERLYEVKENYKKFLSELDSGAY